MPPTLPLAASVPAPSASACTLTMHPTATVPAAVPAPTGCMPTILPSDAVVSIPEVAPACGPILPIPAPEAGHRVSLSRAHSTCRIPEFTMHYAHNFQRVLSLMG